MEYGWEVQRVIRSLGMTEIISAPMSPWQNPYVERVIGSIRRECTDHLTPMGEKHLRRVLHEYVAYYNESRTHQSLNGNAPEPRQVQAVGQVVAEPVLGGLHHRYSRAAQSHGLNGLMFEETVCPAWFEPVGTIY